MNTGSITHDGVDQALRIIDSRWTVLVLREAFHGVHRFGEFARRLGIARSVLSARLGDLVEAGLLRRSCYDQERGWHEYRLTEKGLDLFPAIVALTQWSERYAAEGTVQLRHRGCGPVAPLELSCAGCGVVLSPREVEPVFPLRS